MRQCDIFSGILLILSIIDFALAAPVLVQEKLQARVDVVHIPKDVISVLGKRGGTLSDLLDEFYKTVEKQAGSSEAHASSSSVPSGPDHGSTSVVQASASNPASSIANPNPLMEPSGPSAAAPMQGDDGAHGALQALMSTWKQVGHVQQADPRPSIPEYPDPGYSKAGYTILPAYSNPDPGYLFQGSSSGNLYPEYPLNPKILSPDEYLNTFNVPIFDSSERNPLVSPVPLSSDHGSTNVVQAPGPILKSSEVYASSSSAPLRSDHGSTNVVQAPVPNSASSIANPDPDYPLMPAPMQGDDEVHGIPHALASTEYHPDYDMGWAQALQPDKRPWTDPELNWDYLTNPEQHLESLGQAPGKRPKYDDQVPNPGLDADLDWDYWSNLDDEISRKQSLPKETGQAHENEVEDVSVPKPNPRSSTERESEVMDPASGPDPDDDEVVLGPPSSSYPKLHSDDQSRRARTLSW